MSKHKPFSTDPFHDPLHNIVVPYKPRKPKLAAINCLGCGKFLRLGKVGDSPEKDKDELGGVKPSRWFCSELCFKVYTRYTGQPVLSRDEAILMKLMEDSTGGARRIA